MRTIEIIEDAFMLLAVAVMVATVALYGADLALFALHLQGRA